MPTLAAYDLIKDFVNECGDISIKNKKITDITSNTNFANVTIQVSDDTTQIVQINHLDLFSFVYRKIKK